MATKSYTVTQKNTLNHKVGDVIKLTDEKAKFLLGKVELLESKVEAKKVSVKPKSPMFKKAK